MKNEKIIISLLIVWPYLYLFPHTFQILDMGNDFELLYYSYKKYIFEFIKVGYFPKWLPTDSSGYSLIFNPFAQYFYPLSWLLYLIGIIIGDLSKNLFWLYTVFGLSIYNVGQYLWLKSLKIENKYALIATIITCAGLKLTEILRFPNAVHAIAWFPWILLGITLAVNKINRVKSSTIIFVSTLMILTAGYPYYILYGFILFSFYFFFLLSNKVKVEIFNKDKEYFQKKIYYLFNCLFPALISFIIVSPWLFKIKEIMSLTRDRNLNDINYSFASSSNLLDQISSWLFPPYAITEGWYYFGIIISIIIIFFILNFFIFRNNDKREKYFIFFFISILIINYQFAAAESSFLFKLIWNKIEFIRNFRIFSRMNIILIPIFSIIIALSIQKLIQIKKLDKKEISKRLVLFSIISIIVFLTQIYLLNFLEFNNYFWDTWQLKRLNAAAESMNFLSVIFMLQDNYWYLIFTCLAFLSFFVIFSKVNQKLIYILIIFLSISELFILANIQWALPKNYYNQSEYNKISNQPLTELQNAFKKKNIVTEIKGNIYFKKNRTFNINYFDDFGIDVHTKFIDQYFYRNGALKNTLSETDISNVRLFYGLDEKKRRIFFSESIDYNNINNFLEDVKKHEYIGSTIINIDYDKYTGDEIHFTVNTSVDGFITIIDNWAPGWKAKNNRNDVELFKALNTYKSVKLSKGLNKISMKYFPWKR